MSHLKYLSCLLFHLVLHAAAELTKYSDCKLTTYSCGDNCNISYPFRTPNMREYCGHPDFEVSCKKDSMNRSMLTVQIAEKEYKISDIDYSMEYVDLISTAVLGDRCPGSFTNTTFDPSLFSYNDDDINLTLYFNCAPLSFPSKLRNISCPESRYHSHYILPHDDPVLPTELPQNCSSVVVVPMHGNDAKPLASGRLDFLGVLQNGFSLNWLAGKGWCKECQETGGACGRDLTAPDSQVCFCPDGSTTSGKCGTLYIDFV